MRRALTLGNFMPFHTGHEFMIDVAIRHSDHLTILVGTHDDELYPVQTRIGWIREYVHSLTIGTDKTVLIIPDPDPDVNVEKDQQGTVVDEAYWSQWLSQNKDVLDTITHVFTSDRYGAEIADRIGAEWFPVDPDRELNPISSTQIRHDMIGMWDSISSTAQPTLSTQIAIVGAESTGKSTMTKMLAREFNTAYAPEWGRIISEAKSDLTMEDFNNIVEMQAHMGTVAARRGRGLAFIDTEAIVTSLFAPIFLDELCLAAEYAAHKQHVDLYVVLAPTVPMVQDGTRCLDYDARNAFHDDLLGRLNAMNKKYVIIDAVDFNDRFTTACKYVVELLQTGDISDD